MVRSYIALLAVLFLCSCSILNNRSEFTPTEGNDWNIEYSPATLSTWEPLEFSTANNYYSRASYQCKNYNLYINSIQGLSFSFYGPLIPFVPVYYKSNNTINVFLKSNTNNTNMVNNSADCPVLSTNLELETPLKIINGQDNLCQYSFSSKQFDNQELQISITNNKDKCKIKNLNLTKTSNWTYCVTCKTLSTKPLHNYVPLKTLTSTSTVNHSTIKNQPVNTYFVFFKKRVAMATGMIVGGATAYLLYNFAYTCLGNNQHCRYDSLGSIAIGATVGGYIGFHAIEDNKGAMVDFKYNF